MYSQKEAINVQTLYDLAVQRKEVWADALYDESWKIFVESKLTDLSKVKVIYSADSKSSEYKNYPELPEAVKQTVALVVCLIGRWFDDLYNGKISIIERFKLSCKPTDFWHETGIFANDNIKCKNMEELISKIAKKK